MANSNPSWEPYLAQLRVGVRMCVIGLLVAYVLLLSMKGADLLPEHMTWLGCVVVPAVLFSFLGALFAFPLWLRQRWWMGFLPFAMLCCATIFALIWFEQRR